MLGQNDTKASSSDGFQKPYVSPEEQERSYCSVISMLRERFPEARLVLISPSSSDFAIQQEKIRTRLAKSNVPVTRFGDPALLEQFDAVLREIAADQHCDYLDVYSAMKKRSDREKLLRPNDGVHLSRAGYDYLALCILQYLSAWDGFMPDLSSTAHAE